MNNRYINLNHYEFVRISGSDALTFLQGQITANLDRLNAQNCLSAALCNLKGRVIADFRVALKDKDCILQTTSGMADIIISTLSKYAVFSKVTISADESIHATGVMAENNLEDSIVQGFSDVPKNVNQCSQSNSELLLKIEGVGRYEFWSFEPTAESAERSSAAENDMSDWRRADILSGVFHIDTASSEIYTPQLLNYDISGVVDFDKGCYTGQEIVARMYYRGTAKKRMHLLGVAKEDISAPAKLEMHRGDELTVLEVISAENESADEGSLILAIMDTSIAETDAPAPTKRAVGEYSGATVKLWPLSYSRAEP